MTVNTCTVQPVQSGPWPVLTGSTARLEGIVTQLQANLEGALGSQDGGDAVIDAGQRFELSLAPGPLSVEAAQRAVDAVLDQDLSASDAAFVQPLIEVVPAPYTWARLLADERTVYAQVQAVISNPRAAEIGIGSSATLGAAGPPHVLVVELNNLATPADCAAALAVTKPYGSEVVLMRLERGPPVPVVAPVSEPAKPLTPAACARNAPSAIPSNSWSAAQSKLAPDGATEIRLCRYSGLNAHPALQLIRSALVTSSRLVHKLVDQFDQLPAQGPGAIACPNDDGSKIVAHLVYPGGQRVRISVGLTGCNAVTNGSVQRVADGYGLLRLGPQLVAELLALTPRR